jgi:hypothetical protein
MVRIIKKGSTKEEIQKTLTMNPKKKKGFEASKFTGIINPIENPLEIQKKLRDEWK